MCSFKSENRILAKEVVVSNDTWRTRLNNNDLIIGASGSGKTSGYVIPNIKLCGESMVISDTKGLLYDKLHNELLASGYEVKLLDFVKMSKSSCYNPLDYVRVDTETEKVCEQDVLSVAYSLLPTTRQDDPFWEETARMVLASLVAFVKEALPGAEQDMVSVTSLANMLYTGSDAESLFNELERHKPDSFAVKKFKGYRDIMTSSKKSWACVLQFLNVALNTYDFADVRNMLRGENKIWVEDLGRKKVALFVNVSDTDHTYDNLINVFYTQAIQCLCREADNNPDGRLEVPVRIILDDYAGSAVIADFDKIISVIRSRNLSVSVVLQSISQLDSLYTPAQAMTILNGCDHMLYLGGQDVDTARHISVKANKPIREILNMSIDEAYLFERGSKPRLVKRAS